LNQCRQSDCHARHPVHVTTSGFSEPSCPGRLFITFTPYRGSGQGPFVPAPSRIEVGG
jgi:hypothetical protein